MKGYMRIVAMLLMLSVFAVSASAAELSSAGTVIAAMLDRGLSMTDVVIALENEPHAQAFLAQCDTNTLAFLHLLCERELQRRGSPVNERQPDVTTYVVNTNTDKFHYMYCRHADSIKEKNRWEYTGTRDELIRFRYEPCKECKP